MGQGRFALRHRLDQIIECVHFEGAYRIRIKRRCEDDFDFRINVGKEVKARAGRHGNVKEDDIRTFFDDDGPQFVFCLFLSCCHAQWRMFSVMNG